MERPLIIKIGGSLFPHAETIIQTITESRCNALILPGGGLFADQVRSTGAEGTTAHWMAILGMEQYGWYLSEYGLEITYNPEFSGYPRVFLPYQYLIRWDPLPHSWEITSDTISAWFAHHLSTDLLILKSIDQIRAEDIFLDQITSPVQTNDLDPAFIPFILNHEISGQIVNGTIPEYIIMALQGRPVPGTKFGIMI